MARPRYGHRLGHVRPKGERRLCWATQRASAGFWGNGQGQGEDSATQEVGLFAIILFVVIGRH